MKNDEKLDIILSLSEEVSEEELTAEEIRQMNYETAMRYMGIAEHMKQYEEQDKYYSRAIVWLKKINDKNEYSDLIRELNTKKFYYRTVGKINLYEEACHIRDTAKSPQDYYSAQTLFLRIASYEPKHPIRKNWVSPEIYARAMECTDSKEQADYCEKMALAQESADRRHSLIASIALIIAILALVLFSRTTMSRRVLAKGYELFGNYTGAFQKYDAVYERTGEKEAYLKYLENRYKAAEKSMEAGSPELAYSDYKAVAIPEPGFGYDDGYKDSREKLTNLEIENLKAGVKGEVVHYARMDWRLLDVQDDKVLLGKDHALSTIPFNTTADENITWENSYAREWLNTTFLTENFFEEEIARIPDTTVKTAPNPEYPGVDPGKDTTDRVFLMSIDEVKKYYLQLHPTETCWWLRTPGAAKGSMAFVYRNKEVMAYGYDVTNSDITIKPALWVSIN
ncbi:MAG: hypothetical protein IKX76_04145 [Eubacterium sp.]|nr:hypothetical protein [Eubacterium sp.]